MKDDVTGEWQHYDGTALEYEPKWDIKRQPDAMTTERGEFYVIFYGSILNGINYSNRP